MTRRRRLHYSASLSVMVAALAALPSADGGGLVLLPGEIIRAFLELPLSMLLTEGDLHPLPWGGVPVFAAVAYFPLLYVLSWVCTGFREGVTKL